MPHDDRIRDEALDWSVRAGDPEFSEWDAFIRWIEQDPAHSAAYDEISAAIQDVSELVALPPVFANDDAPAVPRRISRRWSMAGLAASLALVLGVGVWRGADTRYTVETASGEFHTVALGEGDTIRLSGGTRLLLDRDDPRFARLEQGQALFDIRHDQRDPFTVLVGNDTLVDAGTIFDVRLDSREMNVAVAEGLVVFNPRGQNVPVSPGEMLTRPSGSNTYVLTSIATEQVGEWGEGRLTFEGASLARVAAELTRMTGVAFESAGEGRTSFSGSILLEPVRKDPHSLGALLGANLRRQGERWIIEPN